MSLHKHVSVTFDDFIYDYISSGYQNAAVTGRLFFKKAKLSIDENVQADI
ncbi:hypothetical protein [Pantoea allii]